MDDGDDVHCAACGARFDGDPDEDELGEGGLPLCGECNRARNFDLELELDAEDR